MVLAGRQSKVGHALHVQLVGGVAQVVGLEELHLVGDTAGAELLVGRVLQVPASLGLLHVLADHCALGGLGLVGQRLPDLEVLVGVAAVRWRVPRDAAEGRPALEALLERFPALAVAEATPLWNLAASMSGASPCSRTTATCCRAARPTCRRLMSAVWW